MEGKRKSMIVLVLGIFSFLFGLIPFYGTLSLIPASISVVMSVKLLRSSNGLKFSKGAIITALVLCGISVFFSCIWIYAVCFNG